MNEQARTDAQPDGEVSALKQRIRELEHCRVLLSESPDPTFSFTPDGRYQYVNKAFAEGVGKPVEEIVGKTIWDVFPREEADKRFAFLSQVFRMGEGKVIEVRVPRAEGDRHYITTISPLKDPQGSVRSAVCSSKDITERKRAEEEHLNLERQLLHAQKLESLGILAGGIAHDFNNLLTAILGNTDLALAELPPPSKVRPLVEQIQTASLRAAELTRQMLVFAGRGELTTVPVDLSVTVREMAQLLAASLSKKAELRLELTESLPSIEADPAQLRQIVMNIILNASDAIGDQPGVITVRSGHDGHDRRFASDFSVGTLPAGGDTVFLEIADTGCGIDAATLPRIFDPFFTTKFTGRGLGLAAAQGIILRHSGVLQVRSRPGAGSVFRVVFPASAGANAPGMQAPPAAPSPLTLATERPWWGSGIILLVDDETPVRTMTTRMLAALGFDVLTAADGAEAVALFGTRSGEIRAILLDLTMPRMGGHEAFLELRRLRADVPVILCSGYDVRESAEKFSDLAFSGFLQKPYRLEELKEVLRKALG